MRVRSGNEGKPFGGIRVGDSSLRRQRELPSMVSVMLTSLARAWSSRDSEKRPGWWALKIKITFDQVIGSIVGVE